MYPQHPQHPQTSASRARAIPGAVLAAVLLAGCLTDGPNRTGGRYLADHGILLETPLYKVEIPAFPVDSFWTGDLNPSRLEDSLLLLGSKDGFASQARLAFNIEDTAFIDTAFRDTVGLWLSLGFPRRAFHDTLGKLMSGRDSMRVAVESWVFHHDKNLGKAVRAETLAVHHRRFIFDRQDTTTLLPDEPVRDTFTLSVAGAYKATGRDSLQSFALPKLRAVLDTVAKKALVLMQLTEIRDSSDTAVLLRLGGNAGDFFTPTLLAGLHNDTAPAPTTVAKLKKVQPLVNSRLTYAGPANSLLVGRNRGMHLRLDRAVLLDSLEKALERQGSDLKRATAGAFDLSYFVPFASIDVPLDTASTRIDAGFAAEILIQTDLDSLLPATDRKAASLKSVKLGDSALAAVLMQRNNPSKVLDSQSVQYDAVPSDSTLRRIIVRSTRDTSFRGRDTAWLSVGQAREIVRAVGLGSDRLIISVVAGADSLRMAIHLNIKAESAEEFTKNNQFRDPVTGKLLSTLSARVPRFTSAGSPSIPLRATRGVQSLLNRARIGEEVESDLFLSPAGGRDKAVADTASKTLVPWPVMGRIQPKLVGGKLNIGLTVYLYPLKDR